MVRAGKKGRPSWGSDSMLQDKKGRREKRKVNKCGLGVYSSKPGLGSEEGRRTSKTVCQPVQNVNNSGEDESRYRPPFKAQEVCFSITG